MANRPPKRKSVACVSPSKTGKVSKTGVPQFILAPSAGGTSPKDIVDALREVGKVHVLEGGWGNKIFNSQKNINQMLLLIEQVTAEATGDIWLCGTSFGCRVLTEIVNNHEMAVSQSIKKSLLFIGYPLYGPNESSDRSSCLKQIVSSQRVTFISGDKDEFLGRNYLKKIVGKAALNQVVQEMQAETKVEVIEGGKHNPLAVSKKKFNESKAEFIRAVRNHVEF